MGKINVGELAHQLADKNVLGQTEAELFIRKMFEVANEGLENDKQVKIKWFGTFKVQAVKDRESVDVNTGERIVIEGRDKISFTPDNILKEIINKPFAQFETVVVNDGVDFEDIDQKFEEFELEDKVNKEAGLQNSQMSSPTEEMEPKTDESENVGSEPVAVESIEPDPVQSPCESTFQVSSISDETEYVAEKEISGTESSNVVSKEASSESLGQASLANPSIDKHHLIIPRYVVALMVFVVLVLIAGMGYFAFSYGKMQAQCDELALLVKSQRTQKAVAQKPAAKVRENLLRKKAIEDSLRIVRTTEAVKVAEIVKAEEAAKESKEQSSNEAMQVSAHDAKYDADPRVRTGAYRIVGVLQVVKAKNGETLSAISSRYLGPGMECYLEALNGSEPLKEGRNVKIPKLELKRKK